MRRLLNLGLVALAASLAFACAARGHDLHAQPVGPSGGQAPIGVPPPRFGDALPAGFTLQGATGGYFIDASDGLWAVAWTQPDDSTTPPILHLGVIRRHDTAPWELIWSGSMPTSNPDKVLMRRAELGVPDGFAILVPDGAHSSHLRIYRWDGATFPPVFDKASAIPDGVELHDLDAEPRPVIVRMQPALCFHNWADGARVVTVFRWDGAAYVDATAQFPAYIDEMADGLRAERTNDYVVENATPVQQACFYGLEAYIARLHGDAPGAANACAQAQVLASGWTTPEGWEVQAC